MEYFNKNCSNCLFCSDEHCNNKESAEFKEPVNEYMICLKWIEVKEGANNGLVGKD